MQSSETQFSRIFKSGKYKDLLELSDANLRTDDECNFDVHRVILAKKNDYFRCMFLGMGKNIREFHIPGISGECLSDILCYIYTKHLKITDKSVADLMVGADYLLVENLQKAIKYYIHNNLSEVNCSRILLAAHQTSDEDIFGLCFRFLLTRFEGIMRCQSDDLARLPLDILESILSDRSLYAYDETTVWQAIVVWTQKDIALRMSCVPRLLLTLATEDMEEELAAEILQHEIISQNCFMTDSAEIRSSNDFSTKIDVFLMLLNSYSNRFTTPILCHRIPSLIFVAWNIIGGKQSLYVSYDENKDLWRKLADVSFQSVALIVIGHNIYIFDNTAETCKKFDLRAMQWVRMSNFEVTNSNEYIVVAIDEYIYLLGKTRALGTYNVQVYDTVNNWWRNEVPLHNISHVAAVAIEKKIYVVGKSEISDGMMIQMFDPATQMWSVMSPPTMHHSPFSVVAYHEKIFLIGGSSAEAFDPAKNLWKELPGAFGNRSSPKAIVISDQIIVSDLDINEYCLGWNDEQECFENIDVSVNDSELFFSDYSTFCTVDDVETIRIITKQNRDPRTQLKFVFF